MVKNEFDNVPDNLPHEVYGAKEKYVTVAMKHMTAKRMVGWLRDYAEYAEFAGNDKSAEHARAVANRFAHTFENRDKDD